MTTMTGFVVWFSGDRDFGFLKPQDGPDVFVHGSAVRESGLKLLRPGDEVAFSVETGKSGRSQARDLQLVGA
jgi:CspA family cold shock protein